MTATWWRLWTRIRWPSSWPHSSSSRLSMGRSHGGVELPTRRQVWYLSLILILAPCPCWKYLLATSGFTRWLWEHIMSRQKRRQFCNIFMTQSLVWKYCLKLEMLSSQLFIIFYEMVHTLLQGQQPSGAGVCGPKKSCEKLWRQPFQFPTIFPNKSLLQKDVTESSPVL